MSDALHDQLEAARHRLLDLSLRNRMLNFRPTRRTTIAVVDEMPAQVWDLLVNQSKALRFLAREERQQVAAEEAGEPDQAEPTPGDDEADDTSNEPIGPHEPAHAAAEEPDESSNAIEPTEAQEDSDAFDLPELAESLAAPEEALPPRYTDLLLQTDLTGAQLQTNLLRIDQAATSAMQERGVNLLYLTLGALLWRQADDDRLLQAPLILLPVQLQRTSAKRRFQLTALSGEAVINPSLAAALWRDWRIELPDQGESWDELDIAAWLDELRGRIAERSDWAVTEEIYLTLLSFTKYLMYADLDQQRWPEGDRITDNPLIRALTVGADEPETAEIAETLRAPVSDAQPEDPRETFHVLDADATQQRAIRAARQGRSFVLQGPPGTGKSQTIANIIAECLAARKTVLFVSEKRAALEVVKRRLDQLEIGEFCLELHSSKSSRQAVTGELQRTLDAPRRKTPPGDGKADKISRLRGKLDSYVQALHTPIAPTGMSPYQAMGRTCFLADIPQLQADLAGRTDWTTGDLESHKESLEAFAGRLESVWPPAQHAMRGAKLTQASVALVDDLPDKCASAIRAVSEVDESAQSLARVLQGDRPTTCRRARRLADAARLILQGDNPPPALLHSETWLEPSASLLALVELLRRLRDANQWAAQRYHLDRLDALDAGAMHQRARRNWASPLRWLRPQFWADRKLLGQVRRDEHKPQLAEQIADLKRLQRREDLIDQIRGQDELATLAFADAWQGPESDLDRCLALADWLSKVRPMPASGLIGPAGIDLAAGRGDRDGLEQATDRLTEALSRWSQQFQQMSAELRLDEATWIGGPMDKADFAALTDRLEEMSRSAEALHDWTQYRRALVGLRGGALRDFVDKALVEQIEPELLALTLEKEFCRQLAEQALADREPLAGFNAPNHQRDTIRFAKLDRQWIADTPGRLQGLLSADRPSADSRAAPSSQLGILLGQLRRKRGGRSIRNLIVDAGEIIRALKPCFMMSPLSVSEFLDPAGARFDLVIFDEASQVEPADALGAIARARQLILVGDTNQLPPTTFFSAMAGEAAAESSDVALADMESILDRGEVVLPRLRLGWHYRSRHESLIAFSNEEFYDKRLVVFPAASRADGQGLSAIYEPGDLYDRGKSNANLDQARRIARAVFDHGTKHPELSLGVGAFGRRQQQAILDAVEVLRRQDDAAEEFFASEKPEPFFVKNLETIQGDERDVIFLSVGYGKSEPAGRLNMNFGPLNQEGGWRRLNVLVTRARRRCVVFTSIRPEDFDLSATQARGVHALHRYLQYAMGASSQGRQDADAPSDENLPRAVYNALTEAGLDVVRNVGPGPFHVDLAIRDPDNPDRYLLGIECDGSEYHDEPSARDRERLRLQVLEQLGWRIHRVWSVDWFRTPRRELDRLIQALEKARRGQLRPQLATAPPTPTATTVVSEGPDQATPYVMYGIDEPRDSAAFYTGDIRSLAKVAGEIIALEGPIHRDELARRMAAAWGISRVGSRVADRVGRATDQLLKAERIVIRDEFCRPAEMETPTPRRRDDEHLRDADLICDEEIAAAARKLLDAQFGMSREDLASQTAYLLGFASTGKRIAEKIDRVVGEQIRAGRIVEQDGLCRNAET